MVGMIFQVQGRESDARRVYERVVSLNPRAAVASNNLAYMYAEDSSNLDQALNLAQAAKAAIPNDPDVDDTLGWVYYKRNLTSLAIGPLEQSVKMGTTESDISLSSRSRISEARQQGQGA
jgi:tetratricopeptide (TPR) repeat protein